MQATPALSRDFDVPSGAAVSVVTSLEMLTRPAATSAARRGNEDFELRRAHSPTAGWYRQIFLRIGQDWLWFSRLQLSDADLCSIIHDPCVEVYALQDGPTEVGLLELDFRTPHMCEIKFFGLIVPMIGRGAGRWLIDRAIEIAWAKPIVRLWVHTCTHDHPSAIPFYLRSGFRPFQQHIEIFPDPRLTGILPREAAPHIPIIGDETQF